MKRYLFLLSVLAVVAAVMVSCDEDSLDPESVIVVSTTESNEFDLWLEVNYVRTYNIDFKYRYEEIEADYDYYTVPADYTQSVEMAHIVKFMAIEAYDEVAGIDFTRAYFPKEFFLIGTWEYKNNGTFILGTAEGGRKILLCGINFLDQYMTSSYNLNYYYLKMIHHEFTHILNQTIAMPTEYQFVTSDTYLGDEWSNNTSSSYYLPNGYISAYSQSEYTEDFAEMMSFYICYSEEQWDSWLAIAGDEGAALIETKLNLVKNYMSDSWGIDLDELKDCIQRRQENLYAGEVDLLDLSIDD